MGFIVFILFLLLVFSLFLSLVKRGRFTKLAVAVRIFSVIAAISIFGYWFFESSVNRYLKNSLSTQVINKLPQTLDFYIIRLDKKTTTEYVTQHIGKIRPEHFRLEYLPMQHSNEFWVSGYLGKNMVYFSQHSVPNKNMDQIIEINNYIIQSEKLSSIAKIHIDDEHQSELTLGIWVTLVLLLLFLNLVLLLRRK